jgi:hypothetical protein
MNRTFLPSMADLFDIGEGRMPYLSCWAPARRRFCLRPVTSANSFNGHALSAI